MKLDVLALAAHPDDTELNCAGTLAALVKQGKKVGVVDLTQGEMGTRGTAELRLLEAKHAAELLGLAVRENIGLKDTFLENTREHQLAIIRYVRHFRPDVCFITAPKDRHPDHGKAHDLLKDALFYSGLRKIETEWNGEKQEAWRPFHVFAYMQDSPFEPDIVFDISTTQSLKEDAIRAFSSQFVADSDTKEPQTYISGVDFFEAIRARARVLGHRIGVQFGEGFLYLNGPSPVKNLDSYLDFKPKR
jgi:N-acetylglucosamine malate deacetylase 1